MAIELTSSAFRSGEAIPQRYTGDGENISPPLSWKGLPEKTQELALIVEDPDAPRPEPFIHWVIYKIPANVSGLPEDVARQAHPAAPAGAIQGTNSFHVVGYKGPSPPPGHGVHHYHFRLYALDKPLAESAKMDNRSLAAAMAGHVIGEADLVGTYIRHAGMRL